MKSSEKNINTIDEYIAEFPKSTQEILQKIRKIIQELAPEAKETISYQMPTFKLKKNLVHFAAFKKHIGLYPTPSGTEAFTQELSPYVHGKGSIQFPLNKSIPYDLIEKIVKFRVIEEMGKKQK